LKLINHPSFRSTFRFPLVAHCSFLIALFLYILAGTPLVPFHGDESTIMFASRDYDYWFVQGDINQMLYSESPASLIEQEVRLRNGIISKLLAGFAWHSAGYTLDDVNGPWDWSGDYNYNLRHEHRPSDGFLHAARWSSAVLLAAGVFVIFALGWMLGGVPVAYLASLYYALNPVLLLNGRRIMMEGSLTLFTLLIVLVGVWFLRSFVHKLESTSIPEKIKGEFWIAALVLGVVSGLALASKQTAAFVLIAVYGTCFIYMRLSFIRSKRAFSLGDGIAGLGLATIVTILIFYALNPVWWGNPIGRTIMALRDRQSLLNIQLSAFGGYTGDNIAGFWRQVFVALPQYYEVPVWQEYVGGEITLYESSLLQGVSIGGSTVGGILLLIATLVGVWALIRDKRLNAPLRAIIGGWALIVTLAALLLTPFEWQRYYLLVYPPLGLLAALGIVYVFRQLRGRFTATTQSTT
jgi:4-amino-4-deoxy-L-arabinose transferase-like glycosyltransferase